MWRFFRKIIGKGSLPPQTSLKNRTVNAYPFLELMDRSDYFPDPCVAKVKRVLIDVCVQIETQEPKALKDLYLITHGATECINDLQDDFYKNGSEIETGAREAICSDFEFIAQAYGFDADREMLVAPRDW